MTYDFFNTRILSTLSEYPVFVDIPAMVKYYFNRQLRLEEHGDVTCSENCNTGNSDLIIRLIGTAAMMTDK